MTRTDGNDLDLLNTESTTGIEAADDPLLDFRSGGQPGKFTERQPSLLSRSTDIESFGFPSMSCFDSDQSRGSEAEDLPQGESGPHSLVDPSSPTPERSANELTELLRTAFRRVSEEAQIFGDSALRALQRVADTTEDAETYQSAREALKTLRKLNPALSKEIFPRPFDAKTASKLIEQLDSESFVERQRAQDYLQEMGPEALPLLKKAMVSEGTEGRRRARRAVDSIEATESLDRLLKDLTGTNGRLRELARDRLVKLGSSALPDLSRISDTTDDTGIFSLTRSALREIRLNDPMLRGKPARNFNQGEAVDLIRKLSSKTPMETLRAEAALIDMGSQAIPFVEKATGHNSGVSHIAKRIISTIRSDAASARDPLGTRRL